jgi:hypothetical protein
MMHKAAIAVLLLIAVSYTAGASTCASGPCCAAPATINLTSADQMAEACCALASTFQGSVVLPRADNMGVQGDPDHAPDLNGIPASDSTEPLAPVSRRVSLKRAVTLTETGQAIYLHTGRLRL